MVMTILATAASQTSQTSRAVDRSVGRYVGNGDAADVAGDGCDGWDGCGGWDGWDGIDEQLLRIIGHRIGPHQQKQHKHEYEHKHKHNKQTHINMIHFTLTTFSQTKITLKNSPSNSTFALELP